MPLPGRTRPTVHDRLNALTPSWDRLVRDASAIRSPRHYDELEAEATRIGAAVRDAFRKDRP